MEDHNRFKLLSSWYLGSWRYLGSFLDDSRWSDLLRQDYDRDEAFEQLHEQLGELQAQLDPLLLHQVKADLSKLTELRRHLENQEDRWLYEMRILRVMMQDRALQYAELANETEP